MAKQESKTETQEVSVKSQFKFENLTQKDIPALLKATQDKINALRGPVTAESEMKSYDLPSFGDVRKIDDVCDLLKAITMVRSKETAYNKEVENQNISLKKYPFELNKVSGKNWIEILEGRIQSVKNAVELAKLEAAKAKFESVMSAEDKFKKEMQEAFGTLLAQEED